MLNKRNIGTQAERVWRLLHTGEKWSYNHLRKTLSLENHELNAALGWLAREDKIEFEEDREGLFVFTKDIYFKFYF